MDRIKSFQATHPVTASVVYLIGFFASCVLAWFALVEFSAGWIYLTEGRWTGITAESLWHFAWASGIAIFILIGLICWAAVGMDVFANHFHGPVKRNAEIEEKEPNNG